MAVATIAHRDALRAGTILRDYSVMGVLGGGGFGVVYQARHQLLKKLVAIKEHLPISDHALLRQAQRSARQDGLRCVYRADLPGVL